MAMLEKGSLVGGTYVLGGTRARLERSTVYFAENGGTGAAVRLEVFDLKTDGDPMVHAQWRAHTLRSELSEIGDAVVVTDAGIDARTAAPWVVTEVVAGESLAEMAVRPDGQINAVDAAAILRAVARSLAQAHGHGVVHGGLRPEAVFLERPGPAGKPFRVRLLNYGLAEALAAIKPLEEPPPLAPAWKAPEQHQGAALTPQVDIWSLGLLAFWLFTGKMYWRSIYSEGRSVAAMARELEQSTLDPATERAKDLGRAELLPPGFDDWFVRCVDRDPARRFRDARELSWTLDKLLTPIVGRKASEPPGSPFRRNLFGGQHPGMPPPPVVSWRLIGLMVGTALATIVASLAVVAIHDRAIDDERRSLVPRTVRSRLRLGAPRRASADAGPADAAAPTDAATDAASTATTDAPPTVEQ